jgi:hypothetical protein
MIDRDALLAERDGIRTELAFLERQVDGIAEELHLAQLNRERCRLRLEVADLALEAADRADAEPDADSPMVLIT